MMTLLPTLCHLCPGMVQTNKALPLFRSLTRVLQLDEHLDGVDAPETKCEAWGVRCEPTVAQVDAPFSWWSNR